MAVAPTYATVLPTNAFWHAYGDMKEAVVKGTVGAADTYVTNGFSITPAQLGLQVIYFADPVSFSTGHTGVFDPSTGLLKVFSAAATELANASAALQNATFIFRVSGK